MDLELLNDADYKIANREAGKIPSTQVHTRKLYQLFYLST